MKFGELSIGQRFYCVASGLEYEKCEADIRDYDGGDAGDFTRCYNAVGRDPINTHCFLDWDEVEPL